jgi:hypothetical protein
MSVCSQLYDVFECSRVPAGVLLFGWVEKLLVNAVSIASCNHACKMFICHSSTVTASSENNI